MGDRDAGNLALVDSVDRPAGRRAGDRGDAGHLMRCRRQGAGAMPHRRRGLGGTDRQQRQGRLHAQLGDRAAGALPAASRRPLAGHRRTADRRHLAGHPGTAPARPVARPGRRGEGPLPGQHRQQHGRREAGRAALVHRRRAAVLPPRPAGEARCRGAADLGRADGGGGKDPGRRARRRAGQEDVGLRLAGPGLRGADLRRARMGRQPRRRQRRRAGRDRLDRQPARGAGAGDRRLLGRHHRPAW